MPACKEVENVVVKKKQTKKQTKKKHVNPYKIAAEFIKSIIMVQ